VPSDALSILSYKVIRTRWHAQGRDAIERSGEILGGTMNKNTETAEKTISVPEAGRRYFDLGRGASYAAAARGDIPVIRIGRKLRAPVAVLERKVNEPAT
jgi:hypothetical protein